MEPIRRSVGHRAPLFRMDSCRSCNVWSFVLKKMDRYTVKTPRELRSLSWLPFCLSAMLWRSPWLCHQDAITLFVRSPSCEVGEPNNSSWLMDQCQVPSYSHTHTCPGPLTFPNLGKMPLIKAENTGDHMRRHVSGVLAVQPGSGQ